MDLKRNTICLLPLVAILTGPFWWSLAGELLKPRGGYESQPSKQSEDRAQSFVMDKVVLTSSRGGNDEVILKADLIRSGLSLEQTEFENVETRLISPDGRETLLYGGEAYYDTARQIVTVLDSVLVQTPDGQVVKTEALRYLAKFRKVKTAEDVWLGDKSIQVSGGNMLYDLVSGDFRIGGRVSVDFL